MEILLTSGKVVRRNCNDIVSCHLNDNSLISLDILDFPLYKRSQQCELQPNESQFSLNIPDLKTDNISHGKELEQHITKAMHIDSKTDNSAHKNEPIDYSEVNDFPPSHCRNR